MKGEVQGLNQVALSETCPSPYGSHKEDFEMFIRYESLFKSAVTGFSFFSARSETH